MSPGLFFPPQMPVLFSLMHLVQGWFTQLTLHWQLCLDQRVLFFFFSGFFFFFFGSFYVVCMCMCV